MNRGMQPLGIGLLALALALVGTIAAAQDQDAYLDRYELALLNLHRSVEALPTDAVQAREEIDLAFNALRTLSRDTASGPLAAALERVFERARTAIVNASADDLAVQAAVLEGGFHRLLYDSALRAAADGNLDLARSRLVRLAEHLEVPEADRVSLANPAGPAAALRFDLEAGVAGVAALRVATARELGVGGGGYRALAGAYGAFLLVQDSPRAAATLNQAFVDAANALVDADAETLDATLTAIETDILALGTAARERRTSVPSGATATVVSEPADLPTLDAAAAADAPSDEAATAPVDEAGVAPEPATEDDAVAGDALLDAAVADDATELTLVDVEALRAQFLDEQRRAELDLLEADLAAAGVPAASRPARAEILLEAGYDRLERALDSLAAHSSAAAAAAHRGDDAALAAALAAAGSLYETHLSPVVRPANATTDLDTLELLAHLRTADGLRVQDAVVMTGQVEAVRRALSGVPPSAIQDVARRTTTMWSGLVRTVALLAIGILALVPLFLLNLAFGGGNRNWQLIGVALFLLLVPALYEGIVAVGTLLVTYAGVEMLGSLAAFSVFGSSVAQAVWAAMTLLAVILAITGLYGISAQFGLVGRRQPAATSRSTRTTRTATETVDWDDDV